MYVPPITCEIYWGQPYEVIIHLHVNAKLVCQIIKPVTPLVVFHPLAVHPRRLRDSVAGSFSEQIHNSLIFLPQGLENIPTEVSEVVLDFNFGIPESASRPKLSGKHLRH